MKINRRWRAAAGILCAFMCCSVPLPAAAHTNAGDDADISTWSSIEEELDDKISGSGDAEYDGFIVKLKDDSPSMMMMDDAGDGIEPIENSDGYYLAEDIEAAKDFADADSIEYIEPNYIVKMYDSDMKAVKTSVSGTENDEHLALMNVDKVRDEYGITGEDYDTSYDMGNDGNPADKIVISVIDSGLDPDHEDIDYSRVIEGKSFVSTDTTTDTMGHGTFVTGEIVAGIGNGLGIDGIADDLYVMPLKVFSSRTTTNAIIISAIKYATEQRQLFDSSNGTQGVNTAVINMSLGSESSSLAMKQAIDGAIEAGIIVVCAAGNDEDDRASYPAQYAIGVGSTNSAGVRSYYSQILAEKNGAGWQNKVWVTGPGESYTSLWYTGEYYTGSGTSFSSPQAAALAAVAVSLRNDLTSYYDGRSDDDGNPITNNHYAFRQLLKDTSRRMDNGLEKASNGQDTYYGWGMIDFKAVADTLIDFEGHKGQTGTVSFKADNGAGTELTAEKNNLSVEVRKYTDSDDESESDSLSEPIQPDENGVYSLEIGGKYNYTIKADKYTTITKDMRIVMPSRLIYVSMEGLDYYTWFDMTDTSGATIPYADISVKKSGNVSVSQNTDGSFSTKNGNYTYTISAAGYFPVEGEFSVNDDENEYPDQRNRIPVTLRGAADICSVTFDVTGSDSDPYAEVTVKNEAGDVVDAYGDGAWKLDPGNYTYNIESDYYRAINGEFTVEESDKGTERVIAEEMTRPLYWAFIDIMPLTVLEQGTTSVVVKDRSGNVMEPFRNALGEYRIENGYYTYSVKAEGYKSVSGSFQMQGEILYIDVTLEEGQDPSGGGSSSGGSGGSSGGSSGGGSSSGGSSGGSTGNVNNGGNTQTPDTDKDNQGKYGNVEVKYQDFSDVKSGAWYYEPVNFAVTVGLFNGIDSNSFGPGKAMTRGMLTTVLYRLSGEKNDAVSPFRDVPSGAYYADAVAWAYKNGIVAGKDAEHFDPEGYVTRAQIAAMLYNYASKEGKNVTVHGDGAVQAFQDYANVSGYAESAVSWAYENDIIQGDGNGNFRAKDSATRAEVASVMTNLLKNIF